MINLDRIRARSLRNLWLAMLGAVMVMFGQACASMQAQTNFLNVTDFGAQGDAAQFLVNTVSNSSVVTVQSTNQLSNGDVGKLILLFGAGPATTPTNNQDLIATITQVSDGTNITMSLPAGGSFTNISAT